MSSAAAAIPMPEDKRASVAIDLGAASCRVSLLRWIDGSSRIEMVHRFANAPVEERGSMRWDLRAIRRGIDQALRQCAEIAAEGIRSIGVDGWAVDYVRLNAAGEPLSDPYCYRYPRTAAAFQKVHQRISVERLYALTGVQPSAINTIYQLSADTTAGIPADTPWVTLPEYILHWLGGERVAEYTNATHTRLVDFSTKNWSLEIFKAAGLDPGAAPKILHPGTEIGRVRGPLAELPALRETRLIATACHDTASAIAGIDATEKDWAYISSGTWSLVGALIDTPRNSEHARKKGFTNLGAAGNKICFHKNVNGMWILHQCIEHWAQHGKLWSVQDLVQRAELTAAPADTLDLEHADLLLPGNMPARINAQRRQLGQMEMDEAASNAPKFASLIFHSLARSYARVLEDLRTITGRNPQCIYIVGGGSRNYLLNRLTEEAAGLAVRCGEVESSTVGNLKLQLGL